MVKRFRRCNPTRSASELQEIEHAPREIANWDWNAEQPEGEVTRASRYPAGKIEVFLDLRGKIEKIQFSGHSFGRDGDLTEVESRLKGAVHP